MMEIPSTNVCIDQRGKFKCVKRKYGKTAECVKYCPKSCNKNVCV